MRTPLAIKKSSLLFLVITSLFCSRAFFLFINDPEGPNLLIVVVLALFVYAISLIAYTLIPESTELRKRALAILLQILVIAGLLVLIGLGIL